MTQRTQEATHSAANARSFTQTTCVNLSRPVQRQQLNSEYKSRKLTEKNFHMNSRVLSNERLTFRVLRLKVILIAFAFCSHPKDARAEPQQRAFLYYDSGKSSIYK